MLHNWTTDQLKMSPKRKRDGNEENAPVAIKKEKAPVAIKNEKAPDVITAAALSEMDPADIVNTAAGDQATLAALRDFAGRLVQSAGLAEVLVPAKVKTNFTTPTLKERPKLVMPEMGTDIGSGQQPIDAVFYDDNGCHSPSCTGCMGRSDDDISWCGGCHGCTDCMGWRSGDEGPPDY